MEDACFHSLGLIGRNCEYLEQHLARVGADAQSLQAVSDISAATAKLERTINELLSALEFLRAGQPPKLYPLDLCELLQQVAAQADMVRAQLGVTLELDYGGWTTCRVLADRDDVELLCLHLLSNALRACREGGTVRILLRRSETMWQLTVRDNGWRSAGGAARKPGWKTGAAFWAGLSWGCCFAASAAAAWAGG